jgi:hypothetical protein
MAMLQEVITGSVQEAEMADKTYRFIPALIHGYMLEEFAKIFILGCRLYEVQKVW